MSPLVFGTLFIVATLVAGGSAARGIKDGVYTIKNTLNVTENGQSSILTLFLEALPARQENGLGDVITNLYAKKASTHWEIKKKNDVFQTLIPQANAKNVVTRRTEGEQTRGVRFPTARNGSNLHLIEFFGQGEPQCLKNNGREKNVTFVRCPTRAERQSEASAPFLWEFTTVQSNETTTTTAATSTAAPSNQTTTAFTTRFPRSTRSNRTSRATTRAPLSTRAVPTFTRRQRNTTTTTAGPSTAAPSTTTTTTTGRPASSRRVTVTRRPTTQGPLSTLISSTTAAPASSAST